MALSIIWTEQAVDDLRNIYDHYNLVAGSQVAEKMIADIIESAFPLIKQPSIGQKEPLLNTHPLEYRYLISGNYKLIYRFDKTSVYIALVFDCRQNPVKMQVK